MEPTPVFIFTGFVESGKTTMIQRWLTQDFFKEQEKVVIICCEDGFTEYENLADNVVLYMVENKEDLTSMYIQDIERNERPTAVLLENNCMQSVDELMELEWPENWDIVQISAMIDASKFDEQLRCMRQIMNEQFKYATVVVFNRCDENTKKLKLRAAVKSLNPEASLMFLRNDGTADEELDELPFDIDAPVVKIEDMDFGLWFIDIFENCERYNNKTVQFKGQVTRPKGYPMTSFLVYRYAMQCCADDLEYLKLLCVAPGDVKITEGDWVTVTADVRFVMPQGMDAPSPVFNLKSMEKAETPDSEYVYFN